MHNDSADVDVTIAPHVLTQARRRRDLLQRPSLTERSADAAAVQDDYIELVHNKKTIAAEKARDAWMRMQTRLAKCTIEGLSLAAFMVILSTGSVALEHPASPLHQLLPNALVRRAMMGLLAGGWLLGLIYSAWGQKSGAHINPAVTLAFLRLRRIPWRDAAYYMAAQAAGAVVGMQLSVFIWGAYLSRPEVDYITTTPGKAGVFAALAAETVLSFVLMGSIIFTSDRRGWQRTTGLLVGLLILSCTVVASPLSGLSLNPARSLGSAVAAGDFSSFWLYVIGPIAGMQAAVELLRRRDIRRALQLRGKT